jgi:hypothetical protein
VIEKNPEAFQVVKKSDNYFMFVRISKERTVNEIMRRRISKKLPKLSDDVMSHAEIYVPHLIISFILVIKQLHSTVMKFSFVE